MDQSNPQQQSNPPPPKPRPSPPADVSPAPAPWELKTKLYLFTRLLGPDKSTREDPILQGLPPGSYNPSETVHPSALALVNDAPQWKGGLAHVILVRYEDSPVGPYDELIMGSDGWANPYEKRTSGRITNIYVSTRQSVWNGRHNWSMYRLLHVSLSLSSSGLFLMTVARYPEAPRALRICPDGDGF